VAAARKPGPRRASGTTRALILDEAEKLITQQGMEEFRLQDLAARVGIRPPSIFAHYQGRKAITEAVSRRVVDGIFAALRVQEDRDPADAVRTMMAGLVEHLAHNPVRVRLLMRELAQSGAGVELSQSQPLCDAVTAQLETLLRRGVATGQFRPVPVHSFMAQIFGAILVNLSWFRICEWDQPVPEQQVEEVKRETLDLVTRYLSPRKP